jgi:hypothetical protein
MQVLKEISSGNPYRKDLAELSISKVRWQVDGTVYAPYMTNVEQTKYVNTVIPIMTSVNEIMKVM